MPESAIAQLWNLISGALTLNPDAFRTIQSLADGNRMSLYVVLIAGLSEAIAQGAVLFINRVKPFRFALSLLIAVLLFTFGFVFWALSTWLVSHLLITENAPLWRVTRILGLSYAPHILSVFIVLPYLGVPISILLSVWSFLTFATGLEVTFGFNIWQAFQCGILGWLMFEILQRTIGRPVAAIGRWLSNTAAGVNLVTELKELEQLIEAGTRRRNR